ncbi:MAG: beta-ribofuranosylaminobenzene 5'-phosphate synthase family protein [Halobacteriaceae archaeon]
MAVRVTAGARIHAGFTNLSLANERLYGSLGLGLERPRTVVEASPAADLQCDHDRARRYARHALDVLGEAGAAVRVEAELPAHAGLGSGTQLALAVLSAVAHVNGRDPRVRDRAPAMGRGGRSGVGVAVFERGGFVLDAGHPTARFTTAPPERGDWSVPPVVARHELPADWRIVLAIPDAEPGPHGAAEEEKLRGVVETADQDIADEVAGLVLRQVLPAVADGDAAQFGRGLAAVGRLNGAWYSEVQGGVYRPPAGAVIDALADSPAVAGAGQSSWGPTVYGVTTAEQADAAADAAQAALSAADADGEVQVVPPSNEGATVERDI